MKAIRTSYYVFLYFSFLLNRWGYQCDKNAKVLNMQHVLCVFVRGK